MTHLEEKIRKYKDRAHAYKVAASMARDNSAPKRAADFQRRSDKAQRKVERYERAERNEARVKA
jgi:hypothetical protein